MDGLYGMIEKKKTQKERLGVNWKGKVGRA